MHQDQLSRTTSSPEAALTSVQRKDLLARLKRVQRLKCAIWFLKSVDVVYLNIADCYPKIVKQPMDLGTMERKLEDNVYASVAEYVSDFDLIVSNAINFNGCAHPVGIAAKTMQLYFRRYMKTLDEEGIKKPAGKRQKLVPEAESADQDESIEEDSEEDKED